jgi:hypothetical protein
MNIKKLQLNEQRNMKKNMESQIQQFDLFFIEEKLRDFLHKSKTTSCSYTITGIAELREAPEENEHTVRALFR